MIRATIMARISLARRSGPLGNTLSSPSRRTAPSTAATWPCASARAISKRSAPSGTSVSPASTRRRLSIFSSGQSEILASVRDLTLPPSRSLSRSRMAGGESRLGMRVMYMIGLNHGLAQKSTTILHAYKLAENPRKPAQSRAFAHKDPRKFSLYDGRHRRVGVFAFFHAVGVVPLLSALARGRAQDLQLPDAV